MVRMKEKTKKNQKIIVQTGVVIVILFTLMTIAVGNMITMSSFSTALDSNMSMFTFYLETLGDNLNEYQSLSWLMDYWKANSEALVTEEDQIKRVDNIDEILKKFSNELVYKDMHYTNGIRNGVIAMMIFIFILILLFLYFIVPRPLSRLKECASEYSQTKDTDKLVKELSGIRSRNEIGAFADQFSDMAWYPEYLHRRAYMCQCGP